MWHESIFNVLRFFTSKICVIITGKIFTLGLLTRKILMLTVITSKIRKLVVMTGEILTLGIQTGEIHTLALTASNSTKFASSQVRKFANSQVRSRSWRKLHVRTSSTCCLNTKHTEKGRTCLFDEEKSFHEVYSMRLYFVLVFCQACTYARWSYLTFQVTN